MLVVLTSHPIQYQAPLWREMAKAGIDFEVWFLTPHAMQPTEDIEFGKTFAWDLDLLEGYRYRFLEIDGGWSLNSFWGIRVRDNWKQLFERHSVTHLWIEGWRFYVLWQAASSAASAGLRLWMRAEANNCSSRNWIKALVRRRSLKWLFSKFDQFLCIGSANRRFYLSMGVCPEKIIDAPYCVDNDRFAAEAAERRPRRSAIRDKWNIPKSSYCVLFCGKLIQKKRPLDVISALQEFPLGSVHLLVVGEGELIEDMRRLTNVVFDFLEGTTFNVRKTVPASFVGFLNQSKIVDAYVAADCLVLPSNAGETWGLVVNEAMASGLQCIVSDQCGCSEDLLLAERIYPMGDIKSLASILQYLVDKKSQLVCAEPSAQIEKNHPRQTVLSVLSQLQSDCTK